jgi:hypothetical protein
MKGSETVNSEFQIVKWGRSACRGAQDPPHCALGVLRGEYIRFIGGHGLETRGTAAGARSVNID